MRTTFSLLPLCCLFAIAANASGATVCDLGERSRSVEVVYSAPGQPVPCEVVYEKPNEGGVNVLWRADNEAGYCEVQAERFVTKLQSLGWNCANPSATEPEPESR